jgi:hypothetical protein
MHQDYIRNGIEYFLIKVFGEKSCRGEAAEEVHIQAAGGFALRFPMISKT